MRRALLALVLVATLVAGCTLPTDDEAQVLTGPEIDNAMNPTTTSTTSPSGVSRSEELYFLDGEDMLEAANVSVPGDASITDVLNLLGPPVAEDDLSTALPDEFLISDTELSDDGTLTVHLADDTLFEALQGPVLVKAIAQIVVTAIALDDSEVTQVRFELDGDSRDVPTGDQTNSTEEPVDACDYAIYLRVSCSSIGQSPSAGASTPTTTAVTGGG